MGAETKQPTLADLSRELEYAPATGLLHWKVSRGTRAKPGKVAGSPKERDGYIVVQALGKRLYAHRLAWLFHYGEWPAGLIDHRDRDKTNNRIENLREVTRAQNGQNSKRNKRNTSGARGVYFYKARMNWMASLSANGATVFLGYFATKEAAIEARRAAASAMHGDYVGQE